MSGQDQTGKALGKAVCWRFDHLRLAEMNRSDSSKTQRTWSVILPATEAIWTLSAGRRQAGWWKGSTEPSLRVPWWTGPTK